MSTDVLAIDWQRDSPWRRLPWTLPSAVAVSALILFALASFMEKPAEQPPMAPPIDAQIVELPPPPAVQKAPQHPSPSKPRAPVKPAPQMAKPPKVQAPEPAPTPVPVRKVEQEEPPHAVKAPAPVQPSAPPQHVDTSETNTMSTESAAQAIVQPLPKIPDELREEAFDAVATVRFHVGVDGTATFELVRPTPNPRLNQLLLTTLKNWRFFPAMKAGRPVPSMEEIVIHLQVK